MSAVIISVSPSIKPENNRFDQTKRHSEIKVLNIYTSCDSMNIEAINIHKRDPKIIEHPKR